MLVARQDDDDDDDDDKWFQVFILNSSNFLNIIHSFVPNSRFPDIAK